MHLWDPSTQLAVCPEEGLLLTSELLTPGCLIQIADRVDSIHDQQPGLVAAPFGNLLVTSSSGNPALALLEYLGCQSSGRFEPQGLLCKSSPENKRSCTTA